jgi:hypothetical protein
MTLCSDGCQLTPPEVEAVPGVLVGAVRATGAGNLVPRSKNDVTLCAAHRGPPGLLLDAESPVRAITGLSVEGIGGKLAEPRQLALTANRDTVYMSGVLDLREGPMVFPNRTGYKRRRARDGSSTCVSTAPSSLTSTLPGNPATRSS